MKFRNFVASFIKATSANGRKNSFSPRKKSTPARHLLRRFTRCSTTPLSGTDVERLRTHIHSEIEARHIERDRFGLNPVLKALMTAKVAVGDIGLRRDSLLAIMLYESVLRGHYDTTLARKDFGEGVATILQGPRPRPGALQQDSRRGERELPQPAPLLRRGHARGAHHDRRSRLPDAPIRDTPNKEAQHEVAGGGQLPLRPP